MRTRSTIELVALTLPLSLLLTVPAAADPDEADDVWDALTGGKVTVNLRARFEYADSAADGLRSSQAWTLRSRLGYATKPLNGVSVFGEFENVAALEEDEYRDPTEGPGDRTIIADPQDTEVNQAFLKIAPEDADLSIALGRQRLVLDDARFLGNVGWRQNEQTFDAATVRTSFGAEGVQLTYGYLWDINRIFGDQGGAGTRDWESNSHVLNLSYSGLGSAELTGFAYILEFDSAPANSSNSYGFRVNGRHAIDDELSLLYEGSFAYQTDGGGGDGRNPVEYEAPYVHGMGGFGYKPLGELGVGYELLGSDDGNARFVTPLATAHKFDGWADVFLNNGGADGLRDLYAYFAPRLPSGLKSRLVYHHFESDHDSRTLGDEFDAVISKAVNENLSLLGKFAHFAADGGSDLADITRFWLEATVKF